MILIPPYPAPIINRDQLIKDHLPMIDFFVSRMQTQVPSYMSKDDIASAATAGLIDAANRFDPSKGIQFKTFAERRIRGAVIDEVRRMDWFSRTQRSKHSQLTDAIQKLEHRLGRSADEDEIAEAMGMGIDEYRELLSEVSYLGCVSLNESLSADDEDGATFMDSLEDTESKNPEERVSDVQLTKELARHLASLTEKEKLVVSLYYYEELSQKEIAEVLELSEGRVSQLHSQALAKLKSRMLGRKAR